MNRTYPRIVGWINEHPWAIVPSKLEAITEFLSHRLVEGPSPRAMEDYEEPTPEQRHQAMVARGAAYDRRGSVAVLRVMGTIGKRLGMLAEYSGGFGIEMGQAAFRAAMADPDVSTIVLQIDSPGGSVYGVQEFAEEILAARDTKRVVAIADDMAASAAYWLGSAAGEFSVTPSGDVGSIGVVAMHVDYSKALDEAGVKITFIHAGENKVEGNPYEPLSEDTLAFQQSRVDDYYRAFTKAVAKGRNTTVAAVNKDFGQGRVFGAERAKSLGMVDRIETMTQLLDRVQPRARARAPSTSRARADAAIASARLLAT